MVGGGATVSARGGARGAFRPVARRARRRSVRGSGLRGGGRRLDRRGGGRACRPGRGRAGKKTRARRRPEGVRPPARGSIDRGGARSAGALGARRGRRGLRGASLAGARSRGARGRVASSSREAPEGDRRGEPHRSERRPRPADVGEKAWRGGRGRGTHRVASFRARSFVRVCLRVDSRRLVARERPSREHRISRRRHGDARMGDERATPRRPRTQIRPDAVREQRRR